MTRGRSHFHSERLDKLCLRYEHVRFQVSATMNSKEQQ
jgi:hypothetical protein